MWIANALEKLNLLITLYCVLLVKNILWKGHESFSLLTFWFSIFLRLRRCSVIKYTAYLSIPRKHNFKNAITQYPSTNSTSAVCLNQANNVSSQPVRLNCASPMHRKAAVVQLTIPLVWNITKIYQITSWVPILR